MWTIVGIDRITLRLIEVSIATNETERRTILREEQKNYFDLRATRVRMAA
jgi:hypothetical protein